MPEKLNPRCPRDAISPPPTCQHTPPPGCSRSYQMMDLGVDEENAVALAGEAAAASSTNAMADPPAPPTGVHVSHVGTTAGTADAAAATPVAGPAVPPSAIVPPVCEPAETLPKLPAGIPNPYGGVALAVELAKHPSGLMPVRSASPLLGLSLALAL